MDLLTLIDQTSDMSRSDQRYVAYLLESMSAAIYANDLGAAQKYLDRLSYLLEKR